MKKLMTSLMLCGVVLMAAPVSVKAADTDTGKDQSFATGETKVTIEFEAADLTKAKPVNPDSPNTEVVPEPGHGVLLRPNPNGPSFLYVTDNLTFGNARISMFKTQTYHANLIKPNQSSQTGLDSKAGENAFDWTKKFVLEIADGRGEDAGDWQLKVAGAAPETNGGHEGDTTTHKLEGVEMIWPTEGNKTTNSGEGPNGVVVNRKDTQVALNGSSSAPLLSAEKNKGAGITIMQFKPDDIHLVVPANKAKPTTYTTRLTWSLENTAKS